jgi:sugar O-acyltransferase (sialic acid O-acetyltransferase NeuD family)
MRKYFVEKFNPSDDSFIVMNINVLNGEYVELGRVLFSIESSKASIEIEALEIGFVCFNFSIGDSIYVGDLMYIISPEVMFDLDNLFKPISFNRPDDISISKKAMFLLEKHDIKAVDLNLNIIKEVDVLMYIKKHSINHNLDIALILPYDLKKPLVILGAGGGAKMCIDSIDNTSEYRVVGLLDDNIEVGTKILGIPVIGNINCIDSLLKLNIYDFVVAFGVLENRKNRFTTYQVLKKLGCRFPNIIHPKSIIEKSVELGEGNVFLAGSNIGSCAKVGNLNYINNNALISHDCVLFDNIHVAPGAVVASSVRIESNVLIGMNATIYYGLAIGEGSTILNGLIINNSIEKNKIQRNNN